MSGDARHRAAERVERMYVSAEAMRAAEVMTDVIEKMLADYGVVRLPGPRKSTAVLAKIVQAAINEAMTRVDA